jgi:hypothetical protein
LLWEEAVGGIVTDPFGEVSWHRSIVGSFELRELTQMQNYHQWHHLTLDLDPDLHSRIEDAAAKRGLSAQAYIVVILRATFKSGAESQANVAASDWSRLSVPVFARDWDSDADAVYDDLA